jgi:hypothetical protein
VSSYVRNPSRMSVRLLVILILIFNQECTSTPSSAIWHTSTKHTSLLRPPCTASTRQNWLCNITRELYGLTLKSPNSSHQSAFISQQVISMASSSRSYLESKIPDHPVLKDCENGTNMLPLSTTLLSHTRVSIPRTLPVRSLGSLHLCICALP